MLSNRAVATGNGRSSACCWNQIGVQGDRSCPELAAAVHCRNCPVFASAGQRLFDRDSPPEYVDEWTRRLAQEDQVGLARENSMLVFRVGAEWLALDVRWMVEVVEPRRIHRVPHRTDRLLLGLVNIRGELQLCVSLQELLGIDPALPPACEDHCRERLLVADDQVNRWAMPVDEVDGVHAIAQDAMENLPHTVERSARYLCQAVFSQDGRKVGLLSQSRLFEAMGRIAR